MTEPYEPGHCWLCLRAMGARIEWHHPVPRAKKGRAVVPLHPICHQAIHASFSNAELARIGEDRARLVERPELAGFLDWLAGKPPDFYAPTMRRRR